MIVLALNGRKGFSLIEVSVLTVVLIIVITAVASIFIRGYTITTFGQEQKSAIDEARKGITTIVREIREATNGDDGSSPIQTATEQTLTIFSDIDRDISTEKITYSLDGTNFIKKVVKPCGFPAGYEGCEEIITVLSKYVQNGSNPLFHYYNGDYPIDKTNNPLPLPINIAEIKMVSINLEINVEPSRAPVNYQIQSFTSIRNLKENL